MNTDKQTWQEKAEDEIFDILFFKQEISLINKTKQIINWIANNKELIGQEEKDEILKSLSELIRTVSRAMNKKEFISSIDLPRLENAQQILAKYADKNSPKIVQSLISQEQVIESDAVEWISIERRLPNPDELPVLWCNSDNRIDFGYHKTYYSTHWQLLPKPPKQHQQTIK